MNERFSIVTEAIPTFRPLEAWFAEIVMPLVSAEASMVRFFMIASSVPPSVIA